MLTLSRQTVTKVGTDWYDEDDMRWRGAAEKYLATVAERTYLIKPDIGWPSDRDNERVAAAFYRRMGVPVPNVVNATVGGVDACAVRIIPDAHPIGESFGSITRQEGLDVFRGLLLSSLIGDRDRHGYNWIADGAHAYAIDHGLAFASAGTGQISGFATEYVYDMLDSGVITLGDMRAIVDTLPVNAVATARLAWAHVRRDAGDLPVDVRQHFAEYVEALASDYGNGRELTYTNWYSGWSAGDPESDDEDACDCPDCIGQEDEGEDMTWHRTDPDGEYRWTNRKPVIVLRNVIRCGMPFPQGHRHAWSTARGWHSQVDAAPFALAEDGPLARALDWCICPRCPRPAGRQAGRLCHTGRRFGRKVTDIRRNRYILHAGAYTG